MFLALLACATSPPPDDDGIRLGDVESDGVKGVRAEYLVRAPLGVAREVLFDFDRHAEFRPTVLESEILEREENAATVRFRFPGRLGINPVATCRVEVEEEPGRVRISFRRVSGSSIVRRLFGWFDLRSEGGATRVVHVIHMSAFLADHALMRRRHAADSRAIRARLEAAAR